MKNSSYILISDEHEFFNFESEAKIFDYSFDSKRFLVSHSILLSNTLKPLEKSSNSSLLLSTRSDCSHNI